MNCISVRLRGAHINSVLCLCRMLCAHQRYLTSPERGSCQKRTSTYVVSVCGYCYVLSQSCRRVLILILHHWYATRIPLKRYWLQTEEHTATCPFRMNCISVRLRGAHINSVLYLCRMPCMHEQYLTSNERESCQKRTFTYVVSVCEYCYGVSLSCRVKLCYISMTHHNITSLMLQG